MNHNRQASHEWREYRPGATRRTRRWRASTYMPVRAGGLASSSHPAMSHAHETRGIPTWTRSPYASAPSSQGAEAIASRTSSPAS